MHDHGPGIRRVDPFDLVVALAMKDIVPGIHDDVPRERYVVRRERHAVMPSNARTKVVDDRLPVRAKSRCLRAMGPPSARSPINRPLSSEITSVE